MYGIGRAGAFVLLALTPALSVAAAIDKEALHAEMADVQARMEALAKSAPESTALAARFDEISALLGGDRPCAIGPAREGSSAPRAAPAAPTGCTPVTSTFENATPTAVPSGPAVVTSTIVVSGAGAYLWDVDVTTFLQHTFSADLDVTVTSPAGTVVTLTTDNGAGNDNVFNGTVWDDGANPGGQVPYVTNDGLVTDHAYANLTLASPLVPEEELSSFVGEDPNGTWTITISDDLAGDGGSLDSWSLAITAFAAAPIENPLQSFEQTEATAIPAGPAVVTSTLAVSGLAAPLCKAVLRTNLQHTFSADLDITLTSPAGTVITLTSDNGAGNDNVFGGTVWDADANPAGQVPYATNDGLVTDHAYVNLTTATPLVPEESLGAFLGQDGNGTWTITISDDLAGDGGNLVSWGLDLTTCTCVQADLEIAIDDAPDPVAAGANLTYTLTATNHGPDAATGVELATATPAGSTFVSLAAPGWNCTTPAVGAAGAVECDAVNPLASTATLEAELVVAVDEAAADGSTLTLDADIAAATSDPDTANNAASASTGVVVRADLEIALADAPDPVTAGGDLAYTVTVTNHGPNAAEDVNADLALPAGTTLVSATPGAPGSCTGTSCGFTDPLASGASVSVDVVVTVDPAASGTLEATATAAASTDDPDTTNNSATAVTAVDAQADLELAVTGPASGFAGTPIDITATATNLGPGDAVDVAIELALADLLFDAVDAGGGVCVTPAVGESGTVSCAFAGATAAGAGRSIVVTAILGEDGGSAQGTASAATGDPDTGNNSVAIAFGVDAEPVVVSVPAAGTLPMVLLGLMIAAGGGALARRR